MDECCSLGSQDRGGGSARGWVVAMAAALVLWNGFQCWRLTFPMRVGHDGFIGRQIGRTALNHVKLGVGTTRLANVTAIRRDGRLLLHRSYGPAASWTVAAGMLVGLPYDLAIRLPVLVSMNLFLIGAALLAGRLGGRAAAVVAFLVAALAPVVLFRYALLCVFETLGLGPFMMAIGIGLHPESRGRTLAVGALAATSVLYSWIFLVVLGPWLAFQAFKERRRATITAAFATAAVPLFVYLGTLQAATGDCLGDVRQFVHHIAERSSSSTFRANDGLVLTPRFMVELNGKRLVRNIGWLPLTASALALALLIRSRRRDALGWCLGLLVMALLLNFAPNLAYLHDFFILLYVPVIAIACGLLFGEAGRGRSARFSRLACGGFLIAFAAVDVVPRGAYLHAQPESARQAAIVRELGERVRPGDLVIGDASVCVFDPGRFRLDDENREAPPLPFYGGRMCQTVLVATDADQAVRLALNADRGAGRSIYVLNCGKTPWVLPDPFRACRGRASISGFQLWEVAGRRAEAAGPIRR